MRIDAKGLDHRELNQLIRTSIDGGERKFWLANVIGQRYIGAGITTPISITIEGVPGNDLGVFMDGPIITVEGNGQDAVGNTMNAGTIVIHGDSRDITGHSMRGGRIFVRGDVGYRAGIHMKSYEQQFPVIVVGGRAGDFAGEYMAGGVLVILNLLEPKGLPVGNLAATGMHGGTIYLRGKPDEPSLGREARVLPLDEKDHELLGKLVGEFSKYFPESALEYRGDQFIKLMALSHRPYGRLYAY